MEDYFFIVFAVFSFMFGCCMASFLNVCIWRLPRNESVVLPPSHCPSCGARIRWYQNIPVLSWLALRGKCANCRSPISARYVVVELLGGILFCAAYLQWGVPYFLGGEPPAGLMPYGSPRQVAVAWLVVTGLILGSFIDLDHFYLPDRVTIGGMILGVPCSFFVPAWHGVEKGTQALAWSVGGLAFGFFFLWGIGWLFSKLFKKEAMGFGDVKLLGAIGAFFGPVAVLFTIIVSSLVGSLVGLLMMARGRAKWGGLTAVPYGPFLALGVLVWMFWGPALVDGYVRMYGALR